MKVFVTFVLLCSFVAFAQSRHDAPAGQHGSGGMEMGRMNMAGMVMPVKSELEFIRGMVAHHQEAVDSARVVLGSTERPQLRRFAEGVIEVQEREIETLRGWLGAWYPNAPTGAPYTPMMRALPDATPDESDRAFIEDMVVHHKGAIDMSKRFLAAGFKKHPQAEALAREIIDTQAAEVDTLRGWLRSWYSASSPTDEMGEMEHGTPRNTATPPPYTEQLGSSVVGLSAQEVEDLLAGRGAGYAQTAELNSYPGPSHLLELRKDLHLTEVQTAQVEKVFSRMSANAKALGREIIAAERRFNKAFESRNISAAALSAQAEALGVLYGRLRAVHLGAHLEVTPLLSAQQIAKYDELRGYAASSALEHQHP